MSTKRLGVVKFYSEQKEYGFLTAEDGTDIFLHISAIKASQLTPDKMARGAKVEFVPVPGKDGKGLRAAEIRMV